MLMLKYTPKKKEKNYVGHRTYEVPEAAKPQPKCLGFLCFFLVRGDRQE